MSISSMPQSINPVLVRAAAIEDVPMILAIEQSSPSAAHWTKEQYKSRIQADDGRSLVAELNGKICGFLVARVIADEWEIENIVVIESSRRHGIAGKLMQALIDEWKDSTATKLLLEVREFNAAARALYEKNGLREVGRRRGYYRDPIEDAILYTLECPGGSMTAP